MKSYFCLALNLGFFLLIIYILPLLLTILLFAFLFFMDFKELTILIVITKRPLYPFKKHSFHRIYIGLSFPLFANNWCAVFIRYLMYLVDKNGYVVLPVYAERQGV